MKSIVVPFRADSRFPDQIVSRVKTQTRRSKSWVRSVVGIRVGGVVGTDFGTDLEILDVYRERLRNISDQSIEAKGCDDLADFRRVWKQVHRGRYNDADEVVVIKFRVK